MQKLKKVVIILCFPCSDVDTDDKGLMLTSNASHTQTGSAHVPVCFSGENCVFRLNQMVSTRHLLIDHNALETAEKENL